MNVKGMEEVFDQLSLLVSRLESNNVRTTEAAVASRGLAPNDILFAGSVSLDPTSFFWERDFEVPFAAVHISPWPTPAPGRWNFSNSPFPGDTLPYVGAGRFSFTGLAAATVPLVGNRLAIWSAAVASFNVIVLARPVPPVVNVT